MNKKKYKKYIIIGIIIIILVAGYLYLSSTAKNAMASLSNSNIVETEVAIGNVEIKLTGSGVIEPLNRYEIPKSINGEVTVSNYKEGDIVKKDAVIYKIEGINIKAPSKGTLITKNASKGDYISQSSSSTTVSAASATAVKSDPLAVIADISKMKINLEVDEIDIAKVQIGMKAIVTCDARENTEYEAEVTKIASEGINQNGVTTYDVTLEIEKPEGLKIGMNADISMVVENKENVIRIPMDAVNKEKNEVYVYVKDENHVENIDSTTFTIPTNMAEVSGYKRQNIEVGINNKDYIEIMSGLIEGNKIYHISNSKSLTEYMMNNQGGMMNF